MSTASYPHSNDSALRQYLMDVSYAARAFFDALFAAQERQYVAQEVSPKPPVSERTRQKSRRRLLSLAKSYEQLTPNLAAELRHLAERD